MTVKLSDLLAEVSALESNLTKTASAKPTEKNVLAGVLDKLAEDMGKGEEFPFKEKSEEEKAKEDEKSKKDEESDEGE